jgi:hypothetical protein
MVGGEAMSGDVWQLCGPRGMEFGFLTQRARRGSLRSRRNFFSFVILGVVLRGLGVGAIGVLMMSSGMAGWLIVWEQFRVIAIRGEAFECLKV